MEKKVPYFEYPDMGEKSMHNKPEIIVFAEPNGSGKSTVLSTRIDRGM